MADTGEIPDETASDLRTVAKGGAVQIAGQITQRSVSFFFTAMLVRMLGVAAFGVYRQVAQILAVAGQLGLLGFNYAAMRFIARGRAARDHGAVKGTTITALAATGTTSVIVAVGVVFAAGLIAGAFAEKESQTGVLADLLRVGAAYVPLFAMLQTLRYCTQAYKTMVPSVIAGNIVQPVARFVLGAAALVAGYELTGAIISLVASMGMAALLAGWYVLRMLTAEERAATPVFRPQPIVRFALPQAGASLLGVQSLGLGILVLGVLSSDRQAGLFGIALALQGPGTVFLGGIVNIWAPVVADLYERGEIDKLDSLYKTINRWIATFSFPVFAALILEPDLFARIYAGGDGAAATIAILAAGNIFFTGTGPTGYVISMTGHPGVNFVNSIVAVGLYVALGAIVVPAHGAVGMAVVDAIVTAFINSLRVVEARWLVGVQPFGRTYAKPVAATLVGAAVLFAWRFVPGSGMVVETVGVCVAAMVYVAMLRVMGLDPEEKEVLETIKRRALRRRKRS